MTKMKVQFVALALSLLPLSAIEWLLTAFAWLQLQILAAKGQINKHEITKKRKKKQLKSTKRRRSVMIHTPPLRHMPTSLSASLGIPAELDLPASISERPRGVSFSLPVDITTSTETPRTLTSMPGSPIFIANSVDPESILFEAIEQSRSEFEGFLRSVKDIKDVQNWLRNFSKEATKKIAIVKLSRRILETDFGLAQAGTSLAFMYKFGLYPIVVHGGWNELTRDTCSEVIARRRMFSQRLKAEIRKAGVGASIMTPDICTVEPGVHSSKDSNNGGYVSAIAETDGLVNAEGGLSVVVRSVNHDRLTEYLDKGKIPIWDGTAVTTEGAVLPLNGDVTTSELANLIQPFRIIFACNDGGILDKDHKAIPVVYMDRDYEDLMSAAWVTQRRKIQLLQLKRIVQAVPSTTTVVVCAIDAITHQLMYPRLASETIVKRGEENAVKVVDDFDQIDQIQLRILIEDSFGRALADGYFDGLQKDMYKIYLVTGRDGSYNGCAIITHGVTWQHTWQEHDGSDGENNDKLAMLQGRNGADESEKFYYLCKFCVKKDAQGLGLGDLIWRTLQRDVERLYWRSRNNNPLNPWYFARCQGSFRTNAHFTVFWYGDDRFEDGATLITDALSKPVTVLPLPPTSKTEA